LRTTLHTEKIRTRSTKLLFFTRLSTQSIHHGHRRKYENDDKGRQQVKVVRVLCVQAPREIGPQIQKDLFEQWKTYRETHTEDNHSTMSGGMFIPYDVELYEMRMLLSKHEKFLQKYQFSVMLYKCRTLTKEFIVPEAVSTILAIDPGQKTTLQELLLSMTATDTSTKLVRSIERIDGNRFQLIVHKDNIEMCRMHMQRTLELLRNNVGDWHNITETEEGASLAPNGYTRALMISPEKLKKKKTFLNNLAKGKTIVVPTKSNYHHTWQAGEAWGSRGVRGGRGAGRGSGRGINHEMAQEDTSSNLILSTNQTQNKGGGYTVAKTGEDLRVEKQFKFHTAAREKEAQIDQQLTKVSNKYLNDLIEKDNQQEDMEFALETIQSNKGMEAMFKKFVTEAVEKSTKVQTLAISVLEESLAKQAEKNSATLKTIQHKMNNDAKETYEYNDSVHNLFRAQFERLETEFMKRDTVLNTEFQSIAEHIDEKDRKRDQTTMDMFNVMLTKMNDGNFTPLQNNNDTTTHRDNQSNTIPFTDPTITPVKQHNIPTNETSQTPIELEETTDDEKDQHDRQEHNESTVTQEDIDAMEAVMQQSKEDVITSVKNKNKPGITANIHATKNQATTTLITLKSKFNQSKNDSTKYRAHNTRSTRSSSGRGLGRGK
jgi:hypothetical protein